MAINKLLAKIGYEKGTNLSKLVLREFSLLWPLDLPSAEKFAELNEILRARFALQPEFAKVKNAEALPIEDLIREKDIQTKREIESDLFTRFMQRVFALSKEIQRQEKAKSAEFNLEELREVVDLLDQSFDKLLAELDYKDQQQYLSEIISKIDANNAN